jgi:hypothetical protein
MPMNNLSPSALQFDLGLGDALSEQQRDETEEQKRRRRLGLSPLPNRPEQTLLGGVAVPGGFSLGGLR